MVEYQFGYMYWRYVELCRSPNDNQGRYGTQDGNWLSGVKFIDELHLSQDYHQMFCKQTGTQRIFLLPFLLA
jgi:hypothetical protein